MSIVLYLNEGALRAQVRDYRLPCLITVHSRVLGIVVRYFRIVGKHVYNGQSVSFSDLKIVGVVGGGYFNHARTEFHIYIAVGNYGDLPVYQRKYHRFPHIGLVSFVIGINRDRRISHTRSRNFSRPRLSFVSPSLAIASTTFTSVAMDAWSVPGTHKAS